MSSKASRLWATLSALACLAIVACSAPQSSDVGTGNVKFFAQDTPQVAPPIIPLPADGFDFPVGPPDAKKYYNAQGFQTNSHLGEDWNGVGGGNTDLGDPVFATALGIVVSATDEGSGWGNVVRMYHNIGTAAQPRLIESLYAHLDQVQVSLHDTLQRGQQLGTIGDAHGAYWAHLHFELRHQIDMPLGGGYSDDTTGFWVPTHYIKQHRPPRSIIQKR
jgi:murein DD-endopeptidase MepM/ murein hydrolase activator NlpD